MNYPNPHGPSCPWYPITESHGAANIKWCEETLCQWISEPANTWSNLGYLFVGILITYFAIKKKESFAIKQFGPIIFFMGAMSFFFHQSNFYTSQILDFVGMFFFVGWAIGMNFIRLGKLKEKNLLRFNIIFSTVLTVTLHIMYLTGIQYQGIILFAGFLILFSEVKLYLKFKNSIKWFVTSIGLLVVAFGFSISDGKRIWCVPTNHGWFEQGHALWHWIAAIAMFTIYLHYSTLEKEKHA